MTAWLLVLLYRISNISVFPFLCISDLVRTPRSPSCIPGDRAPAYCEVSLSATRKDLGLPLPTLLTFTLNFPSSIHINASASCFLLMIPPMFNALVISRSHYDPSKFPSRVRERLLQIQLPNLSASFFVAAIVG